MIGDLNARSGEMVHVISVRAESLDCYDNSFPDIPDKIGNPNDNVYVLLAICIYFKM